MEPRKSRKARKINIFFTVILITQFFFVSADAAEKENKHFHVLLFAGQSNMVGMRSDLSALPVNEKDREIKFASVTFLPGITLVRQGHSVEGSALARNTDKWETLRPIRGDVEGGWAESDKLTKKPWFHDGYAKSWGYGPEIQCARRWQKEVWKNVAVIKYAIGGTRLATPPAHWNAQDGKLYTNMLIFINERLTELTEQGHSYEIKLLVWCQGESDRCPEEQYRKALTEMLITLQKDLSAEFPVVLLRPVRASKPVREATAAVARRFDWCYWVNMDDLPIFSDNVHIWQDGHVTSGNRVFEAVKAELRDI